MTTEISHGYHHGDLRRALFDAACDWIVAHGAWSFSLRQLSRDLGVSPMAAYRHFSDRDTLLAEVAAHGFESLSAAMAASTHALEDPVEQLRAAGRAYVVFGRSKTRLLELMFSLPVSPWVEADAALPSPDRARKQASSNGDAATSRLMEAAAETYGRLSAIIERGVAVGAFDPGCPRALVLGAWALVHGLAMLGDSGRLRGGMDERHVDVVLGHWLAGMEQPPLLSKES